jgi:hypothetical protein
MRPTPAEELAGARRVLEMVVAPAVADPFAATQLKQVVDALARLTGEWDDALPALQAEVAELEGLLTGLGCPPQPPAANTSFAAVNERHAALRGALSSTIAELDHTHGTEAPAIRARLHAYLRSASERWRMK